MLGTPWAMYSALVFPMCKLCPMLEVVDVAEMDCGWRRGCDWMSEAGGEMTAGGASGTMVRWGG